MSYRKSPSKAMFALAKAMDRSAETETDPTYRFQSKRVAAELRAVADEAREEEEREGVSNTLPQ